MESSLKRVEEHGAVYTAEYFQNRVAELRAEFQADLASDAWLQRFPGRETLKRFAAVHLPCDYITFRNVIMDKMVLSDYRPESMDRILKEILEADQVDKPEIAAVG